MTAIYRHRDDGHHFILGDDVEVLVRNQQSKIGKVPFEVLDGEGARIAYRAINPWEPVDVTNFARLASTRNGHSYDEWSEFLEDIVYRLGKEAPHLGLGQQQVAVRDQGSLSVKQLSTVEAETVNWLWWPYLPLAKFSIVAGDPGIGKTWTVLDLAARITVGGETPNRTGLMPQGTVVILTAEDGVGDTIRPRFDAQGGDASKVHVVDAVHLSDGSERLPDLQQDLGRLRELVENVGAVLVMIDPLNAYMGAGLDTHRDADVRRVLSPLSKLAEATGAAVVGVSHLNKASTEKNPLYRLLGAIGFGGAARSVLLVARSPSNSDIRVVAPTKANLARTDESFTFTITDEPALAWGESSSLSALDLFSSPPASGGESDSPSVLEAVDFLEQVLGNEEVEVKVVEVEARAAGIAWRSIERAKQKLGVTVKRVGEPGKRGGGRWFWALPIKTANALSHRGVGGLNPAHNGLVDLDRQASLGLKDGGLNPATSFGGLNQPDEDLCPRCGVEEWVVDDIGREVCQQCGELRP